MRIILAILIAPFLVLSTLQSQNTLPFWDYRSVNPFFTQVGGKYHFGTQNHGFSLFFNVDYAWLKDVYRLNKNNYYDKQFNLKTALKFELLKNIKIYGKKPDDKDKDVRSWSYLFNWKMFDVDWLVGPIDRAYYDNSAENIRRCVLNVSYSIINRTNTSKYKYLSNTNGRFTAGLRHFTDRWSGNIYLQNDTWVPFSKYIIRRDHGNTTEYGASFHWRYDLEKPGNSAFNYYDELFAIDYNFKIITDRKIGNNTSTALARLGHYEVRDPSIHHGYNRLGFRFMNDFITGRAGLQWDDLLKGRNHQRWAHQGTNGRNLKNRANILSWGKKNQFYFSEFSFWKNNVISKRKFLKQCYYYKTSFVDKIPKPGRVDNLDNNQIKKIYKEVAGLKASFKVQRYVNKFRYKKSRVTSPTALFPWESNVAFYEKPKKSFFLDLELYRQYFD